MKGRCGPACGRVAADFPENREIIREFLEFGPILTSVGACLRCVSKGLRADSRWFGTGNFARPNREIQGRNREFQGFGWHDTPQSFFGRLNATAYSYYIYA